MWIARNKNHKLFIFNEEPHRDTNCWWEFNQRGIRVEGYEITDYSNSMQFKDLNWLDNPVEIYLDSKHKKCETYSNEQIVDYDRGIFTSYLYEN